MNGDEVMEERDRPGWAFWTVVIALMLPVFYCGALGPAAWCSSRLGGAEAVILMYRPLTGAAEDRPWLKHAIAWYSELGAAGGWIWEFEPGNAKWYDILAEPPF
jgi:hypothetical protein